MNNRAKALKKKAEAPSVAREEDEQEPVFPQEHYIAQLRYTTIGTIIQSMMKLLYRKCAERSPIAPIEKATLSHITASLPGKLRENYASCVTALLEEAAQEYEASLRVGTVNMLVR